MHPHRKWRYWIEPWRARDRYRRFDPSAEVLQGIRDQHIFDQVRWELVQLPLFSIGGPLIAFKSATTIAAFANKG